MLRLLLIIALFPSLLWGQSHSDLSFGAGFSHFDGSDGFEISVGYANEFNRYLDIEFRMSYARTSEFPSVYKFVGNMNKDYYWYSKSTILNISPLLHVSFIKSDKNYFSFFAGIGYMFIDAVDNTYEHVSLDSFRFDSKVESYSTISKTIGIKYLHHFKHFGVGLKAELVSPIKDRDKYFGQDNYRAVSLLLNKKL